MRIDGGYKNCFLIIFRNTKRNFLVDIYNVIKAPNRYRVQVSDTTMLPKAASLPGQLRIRFN